MTNNKAAKFSLGQIVATPAALELLRKLNLNPSTFIDRHVTGDWGDLSPADKQANDDALSPKHPDRILSSYKIPGNNKVWVISEWDRSVTTVLLPEDY